MLDIIAEIGQNHNGSLQTAKDMVDSLIGTGVRAIKTAKRDINSFPESWKTMEYKGENSFADNYYDHRCALELSNDEFIELSHYSRNKDFDFISSFTDIAVPIGRNISTREPNLINPISSACFTFCPVCR